MAPTAATDRPWVPAPTPQLDPRSTPIGHPAGELESAVATWAAC